MEGYYYSIFINRFPRGENKLFFSTACTHDVAHIITPLSLVAQVATAIKLFSFATFKK